MNRLNKEKQAQIISALVEGNSLRATSRMCDVAFNTVLKLFSDSCVDRRIYFYPCLRVHGLNRTLARKSGPIRLQPDFHI